MFFRIPMATIRTNPLYTIVYYSMNNESMTETKKQEKATSSMMPLTTMAVLETIGFWSRGGIIGRGKPLPEGTEGIEGLMICLSLDHLTAKAWWDFRNSM